MGHAKLGRDSGGFWSEVKPFDQYFIPFIRFRIQFTKFIFACVLFFLSLE